MKTIVALIDFSDVTFKLLKQAHHLATAFDSQVILLHVVPPQPVVVDIGVVAPTVFHAPSPESVEADLAKMAELQKSLTKFGVRTSALQIQAMNVHDLMAACRRVHADLIIVGSHDHGLFYNLLFGSITADVLKEAPCSVLVVPEDAPDGAEASKETKESSLVSSVT